MDNSQLNKTVLLSKWNNNSLIIIKAQLKAPLKAATRKTSINKVSRLVEKQFGYLI